jgi:hypothetical protein
MNVLIEIGKILAEGLKNHPPLAAIVLIAVVGAAAMIVFPAKNKLPWFFGFLVAVLLSVVLVFSLELNAQKKELSSLPSVQLTANPQAVSIVDQLTDTQKEDIRKVLGEAAKDAANELKVSQDLVRANLFAPAENNELRIIKQLSHNMKRPEELDISIEVGSGSTGRSFLSGQPNIAVFTDGWGPDALEELQTKKIHPDLQWIISVPVKGKGGQTRPIWIMNVDCLKIPQEETKLRSVLSRLYPWSYAISLIISETQPTVYRQASDKSLKPLEAFRLTTESGPTIQKKEERNTLVSNIQTTDVAAPTKEFVKSTTEIKSLPSLNSFTKSTFHAEVQKHFVSDNAPK